MSPVDERFRDWLITPAGWLVQQHYVTATNAACQFKLLLSIGATPIDLLDDSVAHASMTLLYQK